MFYHLKRSQARHLYSLFILLNTHCSIQQLLLSAYYALGNVLHGKEAALSTAGTVSASLKLTVFGRGDGNREFRKCVALRTMEMVICAVKRHRAGKGLREGWGSVAFLWIRCSGKFSVIKVHLRRDPKKSKAANILDIWGEALQAQATAGCGGREVGACTDSLRSSKLARRSAAEWQREVSP